MELFGNGFQVSQVLVITTVTELHKVTSINFKAMAGAISMLICKHCLASVRFPSRNNCAAFFLLVCRRLLRERCSFVLFQL